MKFKLLLVIFAAGALEAQLISGGGGSGGVSTPPTANTCAGPGTSCVVDVSSMGISSLTKVIYACKSATGADIPVTSTSTAGSPNLTSVTLNWTGSLSNITCTVQAGGSPGTNGSNGLSTATYAVTFTNETTKVVASTVLAAAGITLPTHVSPAGLVDYSDDGSHNITLTAGIPITATVYIEGGGAYVDTDVTMAANSDSKVASQKAAKAYVDTGLGTRTAAIASGTATLGTGAIASTACASVVTVGATGAATTDVISWTPNADITAVTGYAAATAGGLSIYPYPTANNVNFKVCNPTSSSITPGAVTLNWRVSR